MFRYSRRHKRRRPLAVLNQQSSMETRKSTYKEAAAMAPQTADTAAKREVVDVGRQEAEADARREVEAACKQT